MKTTKIKKKKARNQTFIHTKFKTIKTGAIDTQIYYSNLSNVERGMQYVNDY